MVAPWGLRKLGPKLFDRAPNLLISQPVPRTSVSARHYNGRTRTTSPTPSSHLCNDAYLHRNQFIADIKSGHNSNLTISRSYVSGPYGSGAGSRARSSRVVVGRHVREALANGSPIVALESTVVTHGLPEPQNLQLALGLEDEIARGQWWQESAGGSLAATAQADQGSLSNRFSGAVVPATIGIVKGQLVIGLSRDEIEFLACKERSRPIKASRRDIPIALARKLSAGTTVAATMAIASSLPAYVHSGELGGASGSWPGANHGAAIKVFATGGMGGVHVGGQHSMDISADLYEFARSPIGVVSSGFKSFLDTRRSLEFLETMGATVTSLRPSYESTYQANCAGLSKTTPDSARRAGNGDEKDVDASASCGRANNDNTQQQQQQLRRQLEPHQAASGHLFPGFFSAINKERVKSPWQCQNVREAAEILFECLEAPMFGAAGGAAQQQHHHRQGPASAWASARRAMLLACPIPQKFSLDLDEDLDYKRAMESTCSIDKRLDLAGNEKTPLILEQLNRITGGKTLRANMELLRNNARIGAHLAYEYAQLANRGSPGSLRGRAAPAGRPDANRAPDRPEWSPAAAVVIGCTMIDMHVVTKIDQQFKTNPSHSGVTFEGRPHLTLGGVARNLASGLALLGHEPTFVTSLGRDNLANFALAELNKVGLDENRLHVCWPDSLTAKIDPLEALEGGGAELSKQIPQIASLSANESPDSSTCFALVLMDSLSGQCEYVIANLEANKSICRRQMDDRLIGLLDQAPLVVMDANLSDETVAYLLDHCSQNQVPIFLEPTDVVCLARLVGLLGQMQGHSRQSLSYLSPNIIELAEILHHFERNQGNSIKSSEHHDSMADLETHGKRVEADSVSLEQVHEMANRLMDKYLPELKCLIVTMDKRGVFMAIRTDQNQSDDSMSQMRLMELDQAFAGPTKVLSKHFAPPRTVKSPVSVSGAGDSFAAGFISGLLDNSILQDCIDRGFEAAYLSLLDKDTIPLGLTELATKRRRNK